MQEIKCPKCGEVFQVDESGYAAIVRQVRDKEFEKELSERKAQYLSEKENAVLLAQTQTRQELAEEISRLQAKLAAAESARQLAEADARSRQEKLLSEQEKALSQKDAQISLLNAKITSVQETADKDIALAVSKAAAQKEKQINEMDRQIYDLTGRIEHAKQETRLREQNIKEQYEERLRMKDEEIAYYKDFKARQSTKMIGESLEQHCETEFNKLRATGFQNAYFEKDNDARTGSKGDYIYKETDPDGIEFISIMFEMKNEMDETATKKKNEDFFRELDKDRREKDCEYAVLVSMLEPDSELYNTGIVDVSYRYPKMYVIRPQFFIPMITLLRNASLNALRYKQELAVIKNQNIDISHFEEDMNDFKEKFNRNFRLASERLSWMTDDHRRRMQDIADRLGRGLDEIDACIARTGIMADEIAQVMQESLARRTYTMSLMAMVFLPSTFLTGLFGVNLGGIPGGGWQFGFSLFCILLVVLIGGVTLWLHRSKWL